MVNGNYSKTLYYFMLGTINFLGLHIGSWFTIPIKFHRDDRYQRWNGFWYHAFGCHCAEDGYGKEEIEPYFHCEAFTTVSPKL